MVYVRHLTHFGHKNIVRGVSDWTNKEKTRDFETVQDHDDFILNEINKVVKPTDTLWHLGDFGLGFAWKERLPELRAKINCQNIKFLIGNHDHVIEEACSAAFPNPLQESIKKCFSWTGYIKFGKIGGRYLVLCHYAMKTWPWQNQNSIQLYGHSHGNLKDDPNSLSIDVGVDTSLFGHKKYTPYNIEEVFQIMNTQKVFKSIDHH